MQWYVHFMILVYVEQASLKLSSFIHSAFDSHTHTHKDITLLSASAFLPLPAPLCMCNSTSEHKCIMAARRCSFM